MKHRHYSVRLAEMIGAAVEGYMRDPESGVIAGARYVYMRESTAEADGELRIIRDGAPIPSGWILAINERYPVAADRNQARNWLRDRVGSLQILAFDF